MTPKSRACRVSLHHADGPCTTHSSHRRGCSRAGLGTDGQTAVRAAPPGAASRTRAVQH